MSKMKIHTTKNYDQFGKIHGNRGCNQGNLNAIRESVERDGALLFIMIVNERLEIIDGQHRFEIWKEMGFPLNYVIKQGYSLPHVHIFNQNAKNWGLNEFMESYVTQKYENYSIYKSFKNRYKFGHNECLSLLGGSNGNSGNVLYDQFKRGFFKVKEYSSAIDVAEKIYDFEDYYEGFKRRTFVFSMARVIRKVPGYDHKKMLKKISYQSAKLTDQSSVFDYLKVLEGIYNYRSQDEYVRFDLGVN